MNALRTALLLACLVLVPAGCGDDDDSDAPSGGGETVNLEIVAGERGSTDVEASLRCGGGNDSATGYDDADAAALCRTALGLAPFLARAPDPDRVCTQIYGGPQTARITGTIRGRRIDRSFSRTDGCRISDWDRAQPLIPK